MTERSKKQLEVGPFRIDPAERLLLCGGQAVYITPKAFDILLILISRRGELIEKSELMDAIWGDSFVEEGNLAVAISALRKALGDDDRKRHKYIQTISKRGYRFVGEVREVGEAAEQPPPRALTYSHPSFSSALRLAVMALICIGLLLAVMYLKRPNALVAVAGSDRSLSSPRSLVQQADLSGSLPLSARANTYVKKTDGSNSKAYRLYITGRYFWNKRTVEGLRRSIECFEQAAIEDPSFAPAYAGLADAYVLLDSYGVESSREAYPSAKAAALRSLELDDLLPEAHASLGMVYFFYEWDWKSAEREFRRTIDLDPNYAMGRSWYALDLVAMGRPDEALNQVQHAHDLDPSSLIVDTEVGWVYYSSRHYPKAIEAFRNVIDMDRQFARAHTRLGMAYTAQRDFALAIGEFRKAQELSGPDAYVDGLLGHALALSGNRTAARKLLADLTERSRHQYVPAFSIALICLGLGQRNDALQWLQKAVQERPTYMVYVKTDPLLDSIRSDPRFTHLMDQMELHESADMGATPRPDLPMNQKAVLVSLEK